MTVDCLSFYRSENDPSTRDGAPDATTLMLLKASEAETYGTSGGVRDREGPSWATNVVEFRKVRARART